ncbi:uncharacterized protein JCM15063_002423 [Sporobolomyces koalae]|uniref:uncharacterized protein n=1 Tax=Sporobolomyces koalae TaxID=500713 RepID=UPI00316B57C2
MLIEGIKFSCGVCIRGHRQASCTHAERELFEVKKRGRPITACETCRIIRKESNSHQTCNHCPKPDCQLPPSYSLSLPIESLTSGPVIAIESGLVRTLPNGASDTASMTLVRRASSVRSRSSASSASQVLAASHPGNLANSVQPEEDLATLGRKKSVSKSRRKDSSAVQKPHDLSHGHSAYHSTHLSAQYSPYTHAHPHPPNHAPLGLPPDIPEPPQHRNYPASLPPSLSSSTSESRPMTNEELASSFFYRGFERLETGGSPVPARPDSSNASVSPISPKSDALGTKTGLQLPTNPTRESSTVQDPPSPLHSVAGRPVKERKRSGLAQMYGAPEEEDEDDSQVKVERNAIEAEIRSASLAASTSPLHAPSSFNDYAFFGNVTSDALPVASLPAVAHPLPACDFAVPQAYVPSIVDYSSTAPSAYSAYSGYTPPLERSQSYSVEEEDDPLGALAGLQPQQTDLDILEWISTIAPLPPSSTPALSQSNDQGPAYAPSTLPSFEFQQHTEHSVTTPTSTSLPEPSPSSIGLTSSELAGMVLSPSEYEALTTFSLPADPYALPSNLTVASASTDDLSPSSTSHSLPQSLSQSQLVDGDTTDEDDHSFLFSRELEPAPPSFNSADIHLERYGIDESYFARLGSFEPTATPTSTPVSDALAGWEQRIEQTKSLIMREFGQRFEAGSAGQHEVDPPRPSTARAERQTGSFATPDSSDESRSRDRSSQAGTQDEGSRGIKQDPATLANQDRGIKQEPGTPTDQEWWTNLNEPDRLI